MKVRHSAIREAIKDYSANATRFVITASLQGGSTLSTTLAADTPQEEALVYLTEQVFEHLGFGNLESLAFGKDPGKVRLLTVEQAYRLLIASGDTRLLLDHWYTIKKDAPDYAFRDLPWGGRRMLSLMDEIGYEPKLPAYDRPVTYVVVGQVNVKGAIRQAVSFSAGDLLMSLSPYVKSDYDTVEVRFDKEKLLSMPHVVYGFLEEMERCGAYRLEDVGVGFDLLQKGALEAFLVLHYPLLKAYAFLKGFENTDLPTETMEWVRRVWGDDVPEMDVRDLSSAVRRFFIVLMDCICKVRSIR